ncbi:MAG: hypothetical protein IKF71_03120 [Bacilli bacterium]|nr:hypothetical protein [Bacilli bacterium]
MRSVFFVVIFTFLSLFMFYPVHAKALTVSDSIMIAEDYQAYPLVDQYNQPQDCTGNDSMLGDPNVETSVAWLLDKILTYVTIAGIVLVVVLSSLDFLKVIAKSDDEAMAKAVKKLLIRLILAALLFFVPTITNAMLDIFGLTSESTCGIGQ